MNGVRTLPPVFMLPLPLPPRIFFISVRSSSGNLVQYRPRLRRGGRALPRRATSLPPLVTTALAFSRVVLADASKHSELLSPTTQVVRAPELSVPEVHVATFQIPRQTLPELAHVELIVQRLEQDVKCQAGLFLCGAADAMFVQRGDRLAPTGVHLETGGLFRSYLLHAGEVLLASGEAFVLCQAQ